MKKKGMNGKIEEDWSKAYLKKLEYFISILISYRDFYSGSLSLLV